MNQNKKIRGFRKILYSKETALYLFCLPFIISFLIFFLYPTINTMLMSFQRIEGFNNVKWISLNNYKRLSNIHFYNTLRSNTIYMICTVSIMLILLIIIAIFLNSKILKFKSFFRSAIFVPTLTSVTVTGIAFGLMFEETGASLFSSITLKLSGEIIAWKARYVTGMIMTVTLTAWRELGTNMVYCLSTLQSVPEELYETAGIDGTNAIQKFVFVTMPQIKPIIICILTLTILNGCRMFIGGYVYWNGADPGDIGLTTVRYIYQRTFQRNGFGMSSAIGMMLLAIVLTVNMFQLNFFGLFKKEGA